MKVEIPTHIDDIKLSEYQKYAIVAKDNTDQDFLLHKTLSVFCDLPMQTVAQFPIQEAEDIAVEIQTVLNQDRSFTDKFEMDGVKYGFIPNLEEMTLGEYIDLEEFLKDPKDLHKAASVMYRPIVKEYKNLYDIEPYNGSVRAHETMKDAPLGVISAAVVFFYRLGNELLTHSLVSLRQAEKETLTIVEKDNLLKSTAGLIASMLYPEEILLNSKPLQRPTFSQHYSISSTPKEKQK